MTWDDHAPCAGRRLLHAADAFPFAAAFDITITALMLAAMWHAHHPKHAGGTPIPA